MEMDATTEEFVTAIHSACTAATNTVPSSKVSLRRWQHGNCVSYFAQVLPLQKQLLTFLKELDGCASISMILD